jgi:hypothetical protein
MPNWDRTNVSVPEITAVSYPNRKPPSVEIRHTATI